MREKFKPLGIPCALADLVDLPRRCGWTVTKSYGTRAEVIEPNRTVMPSAAEASRV